MKWDSQVEISYSKNLLVNIQGVKKPNFEWIPFNVYLTHDSKDFLKEVFLTAKSS